MPQQRPVEVETRASVEALLRQAIQQWAGLFQQEARFELSDIQLAACVVNLQDTKLLMPNLQVLDERFRGHSCALLMDDRCQ